MEIEQNGRQTSQTAPSVAYNISDRSLPAMHMNAPLSRARTNCEKANTAFSTVLSKFPITQDYERDRIETHLDSSPNPRTGFGLGSYFFQKISVFVVKMLDHKYRNNCDAVLSPVRNSMLICGSRWI